MVSEMLINQELSRMGGRGYGDGLNSGMVIGLPPILNFAKEPLRSKVLEEVFSGQKVADLPSVAGSSADCTGNLISYLRGFRWFRRRWYQDYRYQV